MIGNKEVSKWMGREYKYHAHFTLRPARDRLILWKKIDHQSLINIQGWTLSLNGSDKSKGKELILLFINDVNVSDFSTLSFFFSTCLVLKTWFELSRVQLYTNCMKGNTRGTQITPLHWSPKLDWYTGIDAKFEREWHTSIVKEFCCLENNVNVSDFRSLFFIFDLFHA